MTLKGAIAAGVSALVLGAVPGCRGAAEPSHELTVLAGIVARENSICSDPQGIDYEGVPFTVRDAKGNVVAEGTLGPGKAGTFPPYQDIRACAFTARVGVPDSPSYSIQVGEGEAAEFTRELLRETRWVAFYPSWSLPPPPEH